MWSLPRITVALQLFTLFGRQAITLSLGNEVQLAVLLPVREVALGDPGFGLLVKEQVRHIQVELVCSGIRSYMLARQCRVCFRPTLEELSVQAGSLRDISVNPHSSPKCCPRSLPPPRSSLVVVVAMLFARFSMVTSLSVRWRQWPRCSSFLVRPAKITRSNFTTS